MKRHALFVGVNDYADEAFRNLRYSLSDAVSLSAAFAARGFDVEVLSNPKADAVLAAAERKAAGLGRGDVFLFFFAGHGFTAPDGSHLLICSGDRLAYLRHNRAGIPVDLLEDVTNGRGCNRAFLLDACRTDVFAGVENRGAETRDLALVSLPDAKVHAGTCCVLRSCDRFCPAMEFDDLGHGVFTRAVMDMLSDESACATPFGETFVAGIRSRMRGILSAHNVPTDQNPCFQTNGEAFFLFDGVASASSVPPPAYHQPATAFVVCPVCGKHNLVTDTFKCRVCGKDHLCMSHFSAEYRCCEACVESAQNEGQRLAQEMYDKGENYYYGRNGVGKDFTEAVKWYRKSAEKGHVGAQYCVGYAYEAGEGVVQDYVEAYKWFVKAAEKGHAKAQRRLGALYYNGDGVEQDYCMALQWFRKAAEQGDAFAQANLGVMYCNGQGVEQDDEEAVVWFRKAAEQGVGDAQSGLGFMYDTGRGVAQDYGEAVKWYRKAAEQGHATAQCNLGFMYDAGRGVAQDYGEAVKWYRKAAEQGFVGAQGNLGVMYAKGRGVAQDYGEAVKWYRKAAEQGDAIAQYNLGVMYDNGQGVEQDYGEAVKWYRKAAKLGNSDAQRNMGLCYTNGKGVSRNDAEAAKWFRKAAEQGNENAQFNLGECYENGDGVDQNYAEALTWYLKAAVREHDEAREALQQLLSEMFESEDDADLAEEWCAKILEEGDEDEVEIVEEIKSEIEEEDSTEEEDDVLGSRDNGTCMGPGICRTLALPGGAKMEMVYCPPGEFTMGDLEWEEREADEEKPHRVRLTRGFWLGKYPVTQAQWKSVMGNNPSYFMGDDRPVEQVTWNESQEFIQKVNDWSNCAARLPTEAEWEYACRAGTSGDFGGAGIIDEMGWYDDNSGGETHPVGQKKPNAWGLYDMHGNVGEWCNDWYGDYPSCDVTDPAGPESGDSRVFRGGSWEDDELACCSSSRNGLPPNALDYGKGNHGFRLCCSVVPQDKNTVVIHISTRSNDQNSMQSLYEQAENYYRGQNGVKEDRAKAFELYQAAAEQGHAEAQYSLGYMYAYGECTAKDEEKALFWYRKAAAQGHEKAGRMATGLEHRMNSCSGVGQSSRTRTQSVSVEDAYEKGENFYYGRNGCVQSYADAVSWYRLAAGQGHIWAEYSLGYCYQHGQGVGKDEAAAVKWYHKAAEEGNAAAQCSLGNCYYNGQGVARNFAEAVKWYHCAAAQENAYAECNLGLCYENGQGVQQDYSEAANLYRKAIANGNERAKESLERVEQKIAASSKTKTMCISSDLVSRDTSSKAKTIRIPSWGDCGDVKLAVVLDDCGNNKIAVIKEIRAIKGVGLAEAVKLIEAAPVAIVRDVAMSECKRIVEQLEKAGARVHYARTLGNALRCARLAKGYSVEQLATKAKILKEVVQELENDDFHRITTPIYGRGFVKLYAECVGLDPKPLVEMFMAEYNAQKS